MNSKAAFNKGAECGIKVSQKIIEKEVEALDYVKKKTDLIVEGHDEMKKAVNKLIEDKDENAIADIFGICNQFKPADLEEHEKKVLLSVLATLSVADRNEKQKKYQNNLRHHLNLQGYSPEVNYDFRRLESLELVPAIKCIARAVRIFLFLQDSNMDGIYRHEDDLFSHFELRSYDEMDAMIELIFYLFEEEGLIEFYGYFDRDEDPVQRDAKVEYVEISKECADRVKVKDYVELNRYLVYSPGLSGKLYRVDKVNGEEIEVILNHYEEINHFRWLDDVAYNSKALFIKPCPKEYRNHIYFYDIETLKEEKIEYLGDKDSDSLCHWIQASDRYVAYLTCKNERKFLVCYDLINDSTVLEDYLDVSSSEICLTDDKLIYWLGEKCVEYNLVQKTKRDIAERDLWNIYKECLLRGTTFVTENVIYSIPNMRYFNQKEIPYYMIGAGEPIQKYKIPCLNEVEVYGAKEKIYYITIDSSMDLYSYNFATKEHKLVKSHVPAVGKYKEGLLKKRDVYTRPYARIVGKWFYYTKRGLGESGEVQWVCLE